MIISWDWIQDYVQLVLPSDQIAHLLSMAGLNHESTQTVGSDLAIDLEITSNRPDGLGHLGIAREIAVLTGQRMAIPDPQPSEGSIPVGDLVDVQLESPELCPRYTARVIRGVRIGPSPDWLVRRLRTVGLQTINNVVDVTNYVMLECGQPLHAFDYRKLAGGSRKTIRIRQALGDEAFTAIDHRTYRLEPGMCVIADDRRAVALGGVMGGEDTEVSENTTDLLIEAAEFHPLAVRSTARKLNLHSPSSYRFERGVDRQGVDWASRRCCELILQLAGGELAQGVLDVDVRPTAVPPTIPLRLSELERVLGITIASDRVRSILTALGLEDQSPLGVTDSMRFVPPSWRGDLTREVDLIEEVARIHGYDQIPEDVAVPMVATQIPRTDRVLSKIRQVLLAAGLQECITPSVVPEAWNQHLSPWSDAPPLRTCTPLMRGADTLRRSLIPSILHVRADNEKASNRRIELFEIAKVYLPGSNPLPEEPWMLGIVSERPFTEVKGILETILAVLRDGIEFAVQRLTLECLTSTRSASLHVDGQVCAILGELTPRGRDAFELQRPATVAELHLERLVDLALLVRQHVPFSSHPAVERDFNLILEEAVTWSNLRQTIQGNAGTLLDEIEYREVYRAPERDGANKKRVLFSLRFRAPDRTLTSTEVDTCCQTILEACARDWGAVLLSQDLSSPRTTPS